MSALTSLAHWIFATQYLEVVLLLPLLLEHGQADTERKQQRVCLALNVSNAYFYIQITTWTCFMLAYTDLEDKERMFKVESFDVANKFLPAILLIVSILLFRWRFNSK